MVIQAIDPDKLNPSWVPMKPAAPGRRRKREPKEQM